MKKMMNRVVTRLEDISPEGFALVDEQLGSAVGGVRGHADQRTQMSTLTLNSDADIAFDFA